jgi:hypothetical protein
LLVAHIKVKKLLALIIVIFFLFGIVSATTWASNPADCPTSEHAQTCTYSDVVCGVNGDGIVLCYDPNSLNPPSSSSTSNTAYSANLGGGFILDCDSYDSAAPFCDNSGDFWCNRNSTCYSTYFRDTSCTVWGMLFVK